MGRAVPCESSNTEVGAWLSAMVSLVHDCDAYGQMLVHHTGKAGESARGASRMEGWASDNLRLTLQGAGEDTDGMYVSADRFLSARGRIAADFHECQLGFRRDSRQLFVAGGSRTEVAAERCQPAVIEYIANNPGCSKNVVVDSVSGKSDAKREVLRALIADGSVCNHHNAKNVASLVFGCPDPSFHNQKLKVR